jgi:hypothetical protein
MRRAPLFATAIVCVAAASPALAGSARECIDAATRAQVARDDGRFSRARPDLLVCSSATCPAPIRSDCVQWLADVDRRTPTVVFKVSDDKGFALADATVKVDGTVVTEHLDGRAVAVDSGSHVVRVEKPGYQPTEQTLVFKDAEKDREVSLSVQHVLATPPPAPRPEPESPSPRAGIPVGSYIGWGVGALGLLGFAGFGLKANLDYSGYKDSCGNNCTTDDRDSLKTTMIIADVSLVVGLVGAGVGTVLYLMRPGQRSSVRFEHAAR